MPQEELGEVVRVLHPVHGGRGDVEVAQQPLLGQRQKPVLVVANIEVTWAMVNGLPASK